MLRSAVYFTAPSESQVEFGLAHFSEALDLGRRVPAAEARHVEQYGERLRQPSTEFREESEWRVGDGWGFGEVSIRSSPGDWAEVLSWGQGWLASGPWTDAGRSWYLRRVPPEGAVHVPHSLGELLGFLELLTGLEAVSASVEHRREGTRVHSTLELDRRAWNRMAIETTSLPASLILTVSRLTLVSEDASLSLSAEDAFGVVVFRMDFTHTPESFRFEGRTFLSGSEVELTRSRIEVEVDPSVVERFEAGHPLRVGDELTCLEHDPPVQVEVYGSGLTSRDAEVLEELGVPLDALFARRP